MGIVELRQLVFWAFGENHIRLQYRSMIPGVDASGAQILGPRSDTSPGARLSWLYDDTLPVAVVTLTLGPEPILPPQQLLLARTTTTPTALAPCGLRATSWPRARS